MSLSEHRGNWNFVGRDVVVLHHLPAGAPKYCAAGIAVETFLKANGIRYVSDHDAPVDVVTGKTPWITMNGMDVTGGAYFVLKHLAKVKEVDLEMTLGPVERSIARAMTVMMEESFEWCLRMDRFVYNRNPKERFGCGSFLKLRQEKNECDRRGVGRLKRSDGESLGLEDLRSVSEYLSDNSFMFGTQPTQTDCVVFGFTTAVLGGTEEHQVYHRAVLGEFENLKRHNDRMRQRFWQGTVQ
jgi:glutathione S-transferase